ncbi:hypothetical protein RKD18_004206 [Streptomyces phaeoluteigriseus]
MTSALSATITSPAPTSTPEAAHTPLIALVGPIAVINTYNPMNVIVRQPADDYRPGQFG